MNEIKSLLDGAYDAMSASEEAQACAGRHGVVSQPVLTVVDDETAAAIASLLEERITGKTVIEIGGGIGLLACHLGLYAKRVWCIEANPIWSWIFTGILLKSKPKNVSFFFGAADEFAGEICGDVALFCTHSGVDAMRAAAAMFAPVVIDVYGEVIAAAPEKFDEFARELRLRV